MRTILVITAGSLLVGGPLGLAVYGLLASFFGPISLWWAWVSIAWGSWVMWSILIYQVATAPIYMKRRKPATTSRT